MQRNPMRILGLFAFLALMLTWSFPASAQRFAKGDEEMQALHEQIGAHLLFRALDLTPEQKPALRAALMEIRATLASVDTQRAKFHALHKTAMKGALAALERGETPRLEDLRPDDATHQAMRQEMMTLKQTLRTEFEAVLGLLTEAQRDALRGFHPMALLGGPSPKDFGCTDDPAALLDQVRFMPPPFMEKMDRGLTRHAERLTAENQGERAKALLAFWAALRAVRDLDEDAYRDTRETLAEALDGDLVAEMQRLCLLRAERKAKKGKGPRFGEPPCKGQGPGMAPPPGKGFSPDDCPMRGDGMKFKGMGPDGGPGDVGPGFGWRHSGKDHRKMIHGLMLSDTFLDLLAR